jgi:hypothetical protein
MVAIHDEDVSDVTRSEHGMPDGRHVRLDDEFMTAVVARAAAYNDPMLSTTAKMLQAIQDWYLDLNDEKSAEALLEKHTQPTIE